MQAWLTDLRKTALLAAIGGAMSSAIPAWNAIRTIAASSQKLGVLVPLALGLFGVLSAVVPLCFLVALYRTKVRLPIPKKLRQLALAAGAINLITLVGRLFPWLRRYWTLFEKPSPAAAITTALGSVGELTFIIFLVAIFLHSDDASEAYFEDLFLRRIAKCSVVLWSSILLWTVIGMLYLVYQYPSFLRLASQNMREIRTLESYLLERAQFFVQMGLQLVPPYVIQRTLTLKRNSTEVRLV